MTAWGSDTIQRASIPEDAEWVSRRQAARTHMRELLGEELREVEEAASPSFRASATSPRTKRAHRIFPAARPLEGRMAPRTQKADQLHSARPEPESAHGKLRRPAVAAAAAAVPTVVPEGNVAAERIAKQTKLADKLSQWHRMQKEIGSSTATVAPRARLKRVAKSQTPLTDRYRNRRLAGQKPGPVKQLTPAEPTTPLGQRKADDSQETQVRVVDVKARETQTPPQAELPKSTKRKKTDRTKTTEEEATSIKVKVTDVKVKEVQPMTQAEQATSPEKNKVGEATVSKVKVTDIKVIDVQPAARAERAALPKVEKVDKAKVTEVKVVNVKVIETQPLKPRRTKQPTLEKKDETENIEKMQKDETVKEVENAENAKTAEVERREQLENVEDVAKTETVANVEAKVKGDEVKEAHPESGVQAKEMPNQHNIETEAVDAQVVGAHVAVPATTRSLLSCVCGGKFGQGDRIQYIGHAFPAGRTVGTILAGTKNGYLNVDWDNFHQGHTGNCQLSSCGGCEKSAVNSRWFTACSDVEILEEAETVEETPKMRLADLVFGAQ